MIIPVQKYVDLPFFISKNPFTNDLNVIKDTQVLKQCVKNLIFTEPGERMFNHGIGSHSRTLSMINVDNVFERVPIINSFYNSVYHNDRRIIDLNIELVDRTDLSISFLEQETNLYSEMKIPY